MPRASLPGDDRLVVVFKMVPVKNEAKSEEAGRPIFDDVEHCEIRPPGSRDTKVHPATEPSHKATEDDFSTEEYWVTYAERFPRQFRQFREQQSQTVSGTPLNQAKFMTPGKVSEMRALNIYTVEQLAEVDGQELKNLGAGGRDLKNRAQEYISESKINAPATNAIEQLAQMKARNEIIEEDLRRLQAALAAQKEKQTEVPAETPPAEAPQGIYDMSDQQLKDYIAHYTGNAPQGIIPRKTLLRMAQNATPRQTTS